MDDSELSRAVVEGIGHTAVPHVDEAKLLSIYGQGPGAQVAAEVLALVREANAMPIEWGDMTLVQGVNDIMARFRTLHPGLTVDALREIGRCVGWIWR
ncbi:hypothetical protein CIW52_25960 [Mycolicibacterium sp. P9-64]|nr:hypothetical protein CIW52_25960 [Mycolicibacterium sp. P9-64]